MAKYFDVFDVAESNDFSYTLKNGLKINNRDCIELQGKIYPLANQYYKTTGLRENEEIRISGFDLFHIPKEEQAPEDFEYFNTDSAVEFFKDKKSGALFMDMGTGKTKTILDIYADKQINHKIVYITPKSLIKNTKKECDKWYSYDIQFFSSEGVGSSDKAIANLFEVISNNKVFLIVDESINFKNADSKRTKRLLEIASLAEYRFILNGTPVTRSILDFRTQTEIIDKKILNMTEMQFARKFLEYKIDKNNPTKKTWRIWSKPHNEELLMYMLKDYCFYKKLDIGINVIQEDKYLKLNDNEHMDYGAFKREELKFLKEDGINFLGYAQKCQHFYTFNKAKIEAIKKEAKHKDTLFFVKFVKWFDVIPEILNPYGSVGIYNSKQKDDLDDYDYGVITFGCGAFGLNLQKFNRIVFVDTTFDYGQVIQAMHRIVRRGQLRDCKIIYYYTNTGLEKIIEMSLSKKSGTKTNIERILKKMTEEELLCL